MKNQIYYLILVLSCIILSTDLIECQPVFSFKIKNKKYEIVQEKKSWVEATAFAVKNWGKIAEINSLEEQNAIYKAIQDSKIPFNYTSVNDGGGVAYIWIGATDKAREGDWMWDGKNNGKGRNFWKGQGKAGKGDGQVQSSFYNNWGGTLKGTCMEPDNYLNNQNCAAIALEPWPKGDGSLGSAGEWNDINQDNQLYFIIEYD